MRVLPFGLLLSTFFAGFAGVAHADSISVRTDHGQLQVEGEKYRLVSGRAPLQAVIKRDKSTRPRRVIVDVVRLGPPDGNLRGASPLELRVGKGRRRILPVRPRLVTTRKIGDELASYAVRYRVRLPRGKAVPIRIGLRDHKTKARVGIAIRFEGARDDLTPIGTPIASLDKKRLRRRAKKRKQRTKKPEPAEVRIEPPVDAGPVLATAEVDMDAGTDPDAGTDTSTDAGEVQGEPEPKPAIEPAKVRVHIANALGGPFRFVEREITISGQLVHAARGDPLADSATLVFDSPVHPGLHALTAILTWEGDGGALFSYLREYAFTVDASYSFEAKPGETVDLVVEGYDIGGLFTDMLERPSVRIKRR